MATSSRSDSDAGQIERVMKSLPFLDCAQMTANGASKATVPTSRRLPADSNGASSRSDPAQQVNDGLQL